MQEVVLRDSPLGSKRPTAIRTYAHGTSASYLDRILDKGLQPRTKSGIDNWPDDKSAPGHVYLTTAYALYFAKCAATKDDCDDGLIVEINRNTTPSQFMYADEDAIAQVIQGDERDTRFDHLDLSMTTAHIARKMDAFRAQGYDAEWSMFALGNCSHKNTVPKKRINRIVRLKDIHSMEWLFIGDPTISVQNFGLMGKYYMDLQAWLLRGAEGEMPRAWKDDRLAEMNERHAETFAEVQEYIRNHIEIVEVA